MKDQDKTKEQLISELEDLREQGVERKRAEKALQESIQAGEANPEELLPAVEMKRIVHELEVRQVELEIQNDELRRTRSELETSRTRYIDPYDLAPVGYFTLSENWMILEANLTAATLLGVAKDSLVTQPLTQFILPEDQEIFYRHRNQLFSTHSPQVCELRMVGTDGVPIWTRLEATASQNNENGKPVYRAVVSDITCQKQVEEALQESEERFRSLFQDASIGTAVVSTTGEFLQTNRAFCEFLGYSEQELVGKRVLSITHPDDQEASSLAIDQVTHSGLRIQRLEKRYLHKSGQVLWGEVSSTLLRDTEGKPRYFSAQILDIGDRKRAEEELRLSERKYRHLHQSMMDAFVSVDMNGFIQECNEAYRQMLGYESEELLKLRHMDVTPEKWHSYEAEIVQNQVLPLGYSDTYEKEYRRKDGAAIPIEMRTFLIKDDHGQPCTMWAIVRDITKRKQAEEALRKAHHELEVSEAIARERAIELAEVDRRKDEFLAILAHELRNPLAPIRSGIDVLRIVPPNSEQAKQILEMMEEQAHNLVRLIDDLLDVSRCTRGKLELRRQRVSLSKIITAAIHTAKPLIHAQNHELTVTQARENLHVHGDPTRLTQIVSNLLNNAAKYMHSGGKILLTTERIGNEVAIRVKDSGIGIASEMLPRIFEMFVQADVSLNRTHGGLGIGLTLVKSLVEMHGGSVEAASEGLGKGSQFTVRLPILQASDVVHEETADFPDVTRSFPCHKILVVDDVRPIAFMLAKLLRNFGQKVRTATNGAEALAMIEEEKPDLILSDISMPEMTGYELAQEIRRRPEWNDIRLVALSGYGQESDKKLSTDAGFNSHMVKPIGKADLESLLASMAYLR